MQELKTVNPHQGRLHLSNRANKLAVVTLINNKLKEGERKIKDLIYIAINT